MLNPDANLGMVDGSKLVKVTDQTAADICLANHHKHLLMFLGELSAMHLEFQDLIGDSFACFDPQY